jgi:uncharacterized protein (TIGR02757 family)
MAVKTATSVVSKLDQLYVRLNRRDFVHPDPLEFLYRFPKLEDREIVGLIAAGLAYGNVKAILRSVEGVLDRMGPSPARFIDDGRIAGSLRGIRHRWTSSREIEGVLEHVRRIRAEHGSIGACVRAHRRGDYIASLQSLTSQLTGGARNSVVPDPSKPSACKRLHLYMRWMVRRDEVDPGGWDFIPRSELLVPLDVHMHRIARLLRFTRRKQAGLPTVLEVTEAFRRLCPDDPVKYDFALTRLGIHERKSLAELKADLCTK